jgi:hypothetical protein
MLMLKTILKMGTKMFGHYLREGLGAVKCQCASLAMEVSESHGRCMIHKHVRTE